MARAVANSRRAALAGMCLLPCLLPSLLPLLAQAQTTAAPVLPSVPLLVRELRGEHGEMMPLRPEIRALLNFFERELKVSFEIRRYPWRRLLANARGGEGLVFGLTETAERLTQFKFSETIYINYVWIVTRSDARFPFQGMADLKGKTLGVARGASYGDDFDHQRNVLFIVEEDDASAYSIRLKKLLNHRMDAMLYGDRRSDPVEIETLLNKMMANESLPPGISFSVLPTPLMHDELHFAVMPEQDHGLIDKLNAAIAKGRRSGEIMKILNARP
jgi:ABC-type amino acid transport substrate-binding protein